MKSVDEHGEYIVTDSYIQAWDEGDYAQAGFKLMEVRKYNGNSVRVIQVHYRQMVDELPEEYRALHAIYIQASQQLEKLLRGKHF